MTKYTTEIKWLQEFYGWEQVKDDFFTIDDWVAINGNVQLIKFDPDIASAHIFESKNIDFLEGFKLYQCDQPSKARSEVPIRFFYSKKEGIAHELKGSNKSFYDLMDYIAKDYNSNDNKKSKWWEDEQNMFKYIRVFFDNVSGRHGRFELINSYESLLNRVKNYFQYCKLNEIADAHFPELIWNQLDYQFLIRDFLQSNQHQMKKISEEEFVFTGVPMVFKNSFFITDINFFWSENPERGYGFLALNNSKLLSYKELFRKQYKRELLNVKNDIELLGF